MMNSLTDAMIGMLSLVGVPGPLARYPPEAKPPCEPPPPPPEPAWARNCCACAPASRRAEMIELISFLIWPARLEMTDERLPKPPWMSAPSPEKMPENIEGNCWNGCATPAATELAAGGI